MVDQPDDSSGEHIEREVRVTIQVNGIEETFVLDPIETLGPRISDLEVKASRIDRTPIITAACATTKGASEEEQDRVDQAINFGQNYFQRVPANNDDRLTRTQTFSTELGLLDQLFSEALTTVLSSGARAYAIEPLFAQKLVTTLAHRRKQAQDSLLMAGVEMPELPIWGPYNNLEAFWILNDFEICAACYRREVECFLAYLARYHKFIDLKPGRRARRKGREDERSSTTSDELVVEAEVGISSSTPRRKGRKTGVRDDEEYATPGRKGWRTEVNESLGAGIEREQVGQKNKRNRRTSNEFFSAGMSSSDALANLFDGGDRPRRPTPIQEEDEGEDPSPPQRPPARRVHIDDGGPPDDDSSDSSDDDEPRKPSPPHQSLPKATTKTNAPRNPAPADEIKFDTKLKREAIPEWDGNSDTIVHWITRVNELARSSRTVYQQLGALIPQRLKDGASKWYYSNPADHRTKLERDWGTMRDGIGAYYMNRAWLDKQKGRAIRAAYRDQTAPRETPSEYLIRKLDLIRLVYQMTDSQLINEIMNGAPSHWNNVLTTYLYDNIVDFQNAIKYHEDNLMRLDYPRPFRPYLGASGTAERQGDPYRMVKNARTNAVGWSTNLPAPKWPKDDSTISKRGSPVAAGGRACRHCGSDNHWDNECKYARRATRDARANLVVGSSRADEDQAQQEYDNLYYSIPSDDEGLPEDETPDFRNPSQTSVYSVQAAVPTTLEATSASELGGVNSSTALVSTCEHVSAKSQYSNTILPEKISTSASRDNALASSVNRASHGLNRQARRRLARNIDRISYSVVGNPTSPDKPLVELRRLMARPPGCSFLGAKATEGLGYLQEYGENPTRIIFDSGSDITLISQKTLDSLTKRVGTHSGLRINLIQVTGSATISGYAILDVYFDTADGPVKFTVEAYVVKGMSTPFILGNDFSDQYAISLVREEGGSHVVFGTSGRQLPVANSIASPLIDEDGQTFGIRVRHDLTSRLARTKLHRRNKLRRRRIKERRLDAQVRSRYQVVIPPVSSKFVEVIANFPQNSEHLFVERIMTTNKAMEDVYGPTDSLIDKSNPRLHVANFSHSPVIISSGQALGIGHNPRNWLDGEERYNPEEITQMRSYATMVRSLLQMHHPSSDSSANAITAQTDLGYNPALGLGIDEDPLAEPPVEGGPKTAEAPPEFVDASTLIEQLDLSSDLTAERRERLVKILLENKEVFGTNGRLGQIDTLVPIILQPGAKPISLPPYPASPANREVIDKQMDAWLELGVIEPSRSPWGAPAFIVWRNGKPRMVIDWRKLNEQAVPDEFPLPRQDDIIQALTGAQWLTTLDALAGFTQMTFIKEDREKTAFRTHRGLYQFVRMPFGYRNGPSVFQRVMQNVLAPYLWIFALVYIDDIVIFSRTFDEHLQHVDSVLQAIRKAKITLSPAKCHFGYQSLLLLGQKVSRLGMSTHYEKVKAILDLDTPRNMKDLQTFLGMMVYFSGYVPFYAWMAHPLFDLLKKETKWRWEAEHDEAFELCKQTLTNAPVRAYAIPGLPYRVYSDACDYGLAAILQQVQPIRVGDLKGTKVYERLQKAFNQGEPVPTLAVALRKDNSDVPKPGSWGATLDDTIVHIERVISYWSRVLQSAERNYSPTEREALALKEGLIKFQPFLEGEDILAITDHAALTWSKTFQNVNRRLLSWGLVFSAYPKLHIVHRAGRIHSNVDPISRLRRRVPHQDGPNAEVTPIPPQDDFLDPLKNMYDELGDRFEEKLLSAASSYINSQDNEALALHTEESCIKVPLPTGMEADVLYSSSAYFMTLIGISPDEVEQWRQGYMEDPHFTKVMEAFRTEDNFADPAYSQYIYSDNGLIFFEDSQGNSRLCVPNSLRVQVMSDAHDILTEGAHAGYARTYNRIAATYYWPRMSRDIKEFANSCDICQKSKPRRHAPVGLLQPIPIPAQPFEVITMDFIPELPESNGADNILVIVDKLTKYALFIPTVTTLSETAAAKLFFHHIVAHFGLPRQVISDRDPKWRGDFWKELCRLMGMKRALTTSYHPQADGQTEIMNQTLEIALRAYIGPSRDDWTDHIDGLMLAYNTTPHSATGFAPAYLLRGFHPRTSSTLMHSASAIPRPSVDAGGDIASLERAELSLHQKADDMLEEFVADRSRAQEALVLGQVSQKKAYNKGRLTVEFEVGDKVLLNPHSLNLLREEKGRGQKLLMKYDGPFEIMDKVSSVAYRLRMPDSYGIHPVINIAHLESYQESPAKFGERPKKALHREDFDTRTEWEIDGIVGESWRKGRNGRRIPIFRTRYTGFGPEYDLWLTLVDLKNSPEALEEWRRRKIPKVAPNMRKGMIPADL